MKTLKLIIIGILFLLTSNSLQAQVLVHIKDYSPPAWGPAGFSKVEYYYLPDIETYYDLKNSQFIHLKNRKWIRSRNLPAHYSNYDLYNGYKVVLKDYHGSKPYNQFKHDKIKYQKGYKGSLQKTIGRRKVIIPNDSHHPDHDHHHNNRK